MMEEELILKLWTLKTMGTEYDYSCSFEEELLGARRCLGSARDKSIRSDSSGDIDSFYVQCKRLE